MSETLHEREVMVDAAPPAIRLEGVTKTFPGSARAAVGNLSLDVPGGQLVVLVGPSGCGKTTTLKMINRLIEPSGGHIYIQGRESREVPLHELRRGIGYVIQQIGLFPHRTVADNIATVPRLMRWDKRRIEARVAELVELIGLDPALLRRYPSELSGGQQQRVGVARALAVDPPVLLMDEPYSAVDPIVREHLQDELLALQARVHKTIVLVTHDIDEAIKLGDQIALLNIGGVLEQYGAPQDLLRSPANEFVAQFLGRERALKRMALLTVHDVDPTPGPVVGRDAKSDEAESTMAEYGVDWIGVRDGDKLLGWVWHDEVVALDGAEPIGSLSPRPFRAWVGTDTPLRQALDLIVDSQTRVAVVFDRDDRYVGMITIEQIARGMER